MSYAIPPHFEPELERLAEVEHISLNDAVERVVRAGLERVGIIQSGIPGLSGHPMTDEEAAVMDEVVEMAMEARSQRWTSGPRV